MIDVFDEEEAQLLRRLFARSLEDPSTLWSVNPTLLGADPQSLDGAVDPSASKGDLLDLLSRITVSPGVEGAQLDLGDRVSAIMLVGCRRGFFSAAERASLPTSDDPMDIADLYPGLADACSQYALLEASTLAMEAHAGLLSLEDRKELVHETLALFQRALRASVLQGYRTGALAADALRRGVDSPLAESLGSREVLPDDVEQNRIVSGWLSRYGWDDLQHEILRRQTPSFWANLERARRAPALLGLPRARGDWTRAEDGYMADVLVAIARAGIHTGMRFQLQTATARTSLPSDSEARLTYRVSRSVALLARQWSSWHPAHSSTLRVRQLGDHLTAPTFASGVALGHMMAEALHAGTPLDRSLDS